MSDTVIRVENLSKKYLLGSQQNQSGYNTLRDAIVSGTKSVGRKLVAPFSQCVSKPDKKEEFWALKDVSFEVKQGEIVGIIGRNGAGKSTLLKILSRITEPTSGRISIKGRVASLLEVGTGFHPELTGRENIFLNGAILGMSRVEIKIKFDEIVEFAEVERFLDTPVKHYSSGMYVRLAFAVAAHLEPEILIVDEVLAVGDMQFQKKCLGKMGEVSTKEGRTVLFVSHNMQAIRRLCSRSLLIEKGITKAIYSIEEAIQQYFVEPSPSSLDIDLDSLKRNSGLGEKVRLIRFQIASSSSFSYGEPFELIITLRCFQKICDLAIGIGFNTLDGNRVMTLDSDHNNPLLSLLPGIHKVSFYLEINPLHPAIYSIDLGVHSVTFPLDSISNIISWKVISNLSDSVCERGYGGCRLPVNMLVS